MTDIMVWRYSLFDRSVKTTVPFKPILQFEEKKNIIFKVLSCVKITMTLCTISYRLGAMKAFQEDSYSFTQVMNYIMTKVFVEQPLALPRSAKKFKFADNKQMFCNGYV